MKRILHLVLVICVLALLAVPANATLLPFPTLRFDYKNPKVPDDLLLYTVDLTPVYGEHHLHKMSYAALHAPSAVWADKRYMMDQEGWSVAEFNEQWNEFLDWWRGYFEISVTLYSDEIYAVSAGPVGVGNFSKAIDRLVLVTSDGYIQEKMMPGIMPQRITNGPARYRNIFTLSFNQEALDSKPEWIRLYVLTVDTQYYFEWKFDV